FGGDVKFLATIFSVGKSALGFLSPAGTALKLAPWGIAAALALGLYVEHERLVAADAGITTAQAQTAEAVQKCQAEASQQAAAESAAAMAQQQKADAAASQAEVQLFAQRAAANTVTAQAEQALGQQIGTITTQAAQAGQDGPIAPVLAGMFP
ncbi:MAG: hypothetical protein KGH75_08275, partial [Rhodospirillales bacterium]|nr:hypothetical protein [Rhodospirillales bacterium]